MNKGELTGKVAQSVEKSRRNTRRLYVVPEAQVVERLARDVCVRLAQAGDVSFNDPDVITGLADFLNLMARILAKQLNEGRCEFLDANGE